MDIRVLLRFHKEQKTLATLTAVQPPGRFGAFMLDGDQNLIQPFQEKPKGDGAWINGGFFVFEPGVMDYIEGNSTVWERDPVENMVRDGQPLHQHQVGIITDPH